MEIQAVYQQLKTECLKCTACTLSEKRTQVVFSSGPCPCDLMLIGEAPGADEDEQGMPFVGRSGQLLTKMLASVNISRDTDIYVTNVCKCRPPDNRAPAVEEMNTCKHWLEEQIKLVQPKIIVLAGTTAMKAILGEQMSGITQQHGKWFKYQGVDTTIIYHPSYLLRYPSQEAGKPKWQAWQDLKAIKTALEYKRTEEA